MNGDYAHSTQATRTSSGSGDGKSSSDRRNPQQSLSQIEKSVTHLLVATKQLLETLTQWSRGAATEAEVSDVYVRLGYEFNIACRTFSSIGVETNDLGPVPDLLRSILEETLSQEASQASLDKFLPRIRDIIINLLHGLKRKQQRLRQRNAREGVSSTGSGPRQNSTSSSTLVGVVNEDGRQASHANSFELAVSDTNIPPRTSSVQNGRASPTRQEPPSTSNSLARSLPSNREPPNSHGHSHPSLGESSMPSITVEDSPAIPYPQSDTIPVPREIPSLSRPLDPGQQLPQQDALVALQQGGSLERRASRRFSAYQFQRQLGSVSGSIPIIPPSQNSPIPNRGREARESINAVKVRGSVLGSRSRNNLANDTTTAARHESPIRNQTYQDKVGKNQLPILSVPSEETPQSSDDNNPTKASNDDFRASYIGSGDSDANALSLSTYSPEEPTHSNRGEGYIDRNASQGATAFKDVSSTGYPDNAAELPAADVSLPKALTLFLQYKTKVKKFVLGQGYEELTIARLQLAFIEKFAWNTHSNGVDLPEIYIQDPDSGVRHELEDLADVKDKSVLVLNIDNLDEVKRHVDDGLGGLRRLVEGVKTSLNEQQSALQLVSERQQEAAKEMARLASTPPTVQRSAEATSNGAVNFSRRGSNKLTEIQGLRRELAVLRQTYTSQLSNMEVAMSGLRSKAASVKTIALKASVPSVEAGSGRAYVEAAKKTLSDDSEKIINRVDDLQDIVEDLRKDVVTRGVRPLPRQLETVSKDISIALSELKKLREFMKREKPIWSKVGEYELNAVCEDQKLLTLQEELATDLEDDLEKAAQTFALVEQATKQQNLQNGSTTTSRNPSRTLNATGGDVDPKKAKDGVLGEVRALQPNHETRLEAIERAEKARQLELESRHEGEFKKELGSFVEEGKLKKSGGVEEAERLRKAKDDRIRREVWERQNGIVSGDSQLQLDVPVGDDGGTTSPEPEFVEAEEQPQANLP